MNVSRQENDLLDYHLLRVSPSLTQKHDASKPEEMMRHSMPFETGAMRNRRQLSASRNCHMWASFHHTDKDEKQHVSYFAVRCVEIQGEGWNCRRSMRLTLILRFLQLAQPLRLLGWLLRETIIFDVAILFPRFCLVAPRTSKE